MSALFDSIRSTAVDSAFYLYGEQVCIQHKNLIEEVTGIYRDNAQDHDVGGLVVGGNAPTLRLYNSAIERLCVDRGTKVSIGDTAYTVVLPIRDNDDGTSFVRLSEERA